MNPASAQKRIAFGYNRNYDKIVLNEGQAGCVWLIFSYYDESKSLAEIKDILEGLNIPSPQNKKGLGQADHFQHSIQPAFLRLRGLSEDYRARPF